MATGTGKTEVAFQVCFAESQRRRSWTVFTIQ
jgi:type I site-specific restriction endonuclease